MDSGPPICGLFLYGLLVKHGMIFHHFQRVVKKEKEEYVTEIGPQSLKYLH